MKAVKANLNSLIVKTLVSCLTVLAPLSYDVSKSYIPKIDLAVAETKSSEIPSGWESYLDRPDILKVKAQKHDLGSNWENLKAAHFSFVAELLALYPADTHIYFLARDSEHLYDVARLVTEKTKDFGRIHLLNVSRANMRDPNIKGYLSQHGISEELLSSGKKVLFVDTGFSGTIPRVIAENFSDKAQLNLKTHLIVSSNSQHPSSRTFLLHLNPSVNEQSPSGMHSSIISYEHMSRYTDRSSSYVLTNGRYHPISPIGKATDGSVSKEQSLRYMADISAEWKNEETRSRYQQEKTQFEYIKNVLTVGDEKSVEDLKEQLKKIKDSAAGGALEAKIRDIFQSKDNAGLQIAGDLIKLGLKNIATSGTQNPGLSKKNELVKKYPEWASTLENPDEAIPKLFADQNWQMIGNLIDADVDVEINQLLIKFLYDAQAEGVKKTLQINMIEKGNGDTLGYLAKQVFSQPHTHNMDDLLRLVIEKCDLYTLKLLVWHTFPQPHTKNMKDHLKLVIEKGDQHTLVSLAQHVFSKPHTQDMKDLLKLVFEKGNADTKRYLAQYVFSKPHTQDMKDLLKFVIENGDHSTLMTLAQYVFSKPHTQDMKDLLKLVIEKGGEYTLRLLAQYVFTQPHAQDMKDHLKLVIEKGDQPTLVSLAQYVFSRPHIQNMDDLLLLIIEKGSKSTLTELNWYVLSLPHTNTPEHEIMRKAIEISDATARKEFLDTELAKIGSPLSSIKVVAKPIDSSLKDGDFIMIKDRLMKVTKRVGEGRRGIVFQVQAQDNKAMYALKTVKSTDADTLASLAQESSKASKWQELKIPHSKVLVQEKEYVLKVWIEGISGEQVVEKYISGDTGFKASAEGILKLVAKIRDQGAYVGDFRPANLIWNGMAWVIVDSGSIQQGMTLDEAQAKWSSVDGRGPKFERRWQLKVPQVLPNKCSKVFL